LKNKAMKCLLLVMAFAMLFTSVVVAETQTIQLMHYMGEKTKRDGLDALVKLFEEQNPGIKIEVEGVDAATYMTTYQTRMTSNDEPDFYFGKPRNMLELVLAGKFLDITDEAFLDNLLPELVEECSVDGRVFGFPMDAQVKATFYNKNLFAEHGVEVPRTLDEFIEVLDYFNSKEILPLIHGYNNVNCVFHELDAFLTAQVVVENEADLWVKAQSGDIKLAESEVMKEAMSIYAKQADYFDVGDFSLDQPTAIADFAAGKRPMFTNGGWIMGDVLVAAPEGTEFGMFPTPWSNEEENNKLWVGIDDVFLISAKTDKKDACLKFLEFLATDEAADIWMNYSKLMSSNVNAKTEDKAPYIQAIAAEIEGGNVVAKALVPDLTAEYSRSFRAMLQSFAISADKNVDEFLNDLDSELEYIRE